MTQKIGYQNLLESASSISVTSEATGFEKELAYNWLTHDGWKASAAGTVYYTADLGSAMSVDYWASVKHTLGTNSGSIKLQYSSDNFVADTNDFSTAVSPSDDTTMFQSVSTAISARYWRWEIASASAASFFGVLSLGASLTLPYAVMTGFELPTLARKNKILNSTSEGGEFLGRSIIRQGLASSFKNKHITLAFARGDFLTFYEHAELKPFFYSWNTDYDDAVYAWMVGHSPPRYINNITLEFDIKFNGLM